MLGWFIIQVVLTTSKSLCNINNCLNCSYRSADICINCIAGFIRSPSGCIFSAQSNYQPVENCQEYNPEGLCLSCQSGFSLLNLVCEPDCPEGCVCFNPNNCNSYNELSRTKSTQTKSRLQECPDLCITCDSDSYCSECEEGYYLDDGTCADCGINCSGCNSDGTCSSCYDDYELSDGACNAVCSENCVSCDSPSKCNQCEDGYYPYDNTCNYCDEGCSDCNSDGCSACKDDYKYNGGICDAICKDENCRFCSYPNVCQDCNYEYYQEDGSCFSCVSNCLICYNNDECDTCDDGYYKDEYGICNPCSSICKKCDSYNKCTECDDYYYLDTEDDTCNNCIGNCKTCSYYFGCQTCKSGYTYEYSKCKKDADKSKLVVLIVAPIVSIVGFIIIVIVIVCLIKRHARNIRKKNAEKFANINPANLNQTVVVGVISGPNKNNDTSFQNYTTPYGGNFEVVGLVNPQPAWSSPNPPLVNGLPQGAPLPNANLLRIDPTNFAMMVPLVYLDPTNRYIGQDTCAICKGIFKPDIDTRALPCMHAFHGRCIYDVIILPTSKNCAVCNRPYA